MNEIKTLCAMRLTWSATGVIARSSPSTIKRASHEALEAAHHAMLAKAAALAQANVDESNPLSEHALVRRHTLEVTQVGLIVLQEHALKNLQTSCP